MLGHYWGTVGVAGLRAVQPTAKLNELVMASFATLFTPLAARLHSRQEGAAINDLYWRSAIWIAILSFPVFALTFSLAGPITALLFGSRYEDSAPILALLAFGYYFNAALGFNGLTLKVLGRVRYMLIISLVTAAIGLLSAFLLIPKLGPIGAGIASATTLVVHNLLKQAGLLGTGIGLFDWRYLRAYVVIAVSALGVLLIQIVLAPSTLAAIGLGVLAILAVMVLNVRALDVQQTFPEATKLPLSKLFVSRGRPQAESPPGGPPESVEQDRVRTT
jgi:O-antigen/teichoic acid export membrane protein